jgi:hypothetical protein
MNAMGHCPVCGMEVTSPVEVRFGETFCSRNHADEFVAKVQAARIQAAAALTEPPSPAPASTSKPRDWKHYVKLGICVGAPLLALALLVGRGGAVLGAAGALLPVLALLACPLAVYFLMRSMPKMAENPHGEEEQK